MCILYEAYDIFFNSLYMYIGIDISHGYVESRSQNFRSIYLNIIYFFLAEMQMISGLNREYENFESAKSKFYIVTILC